MKIKTIRWRLDQAEQFDGELNKALADGYQLVKRAIIPGFRLDGGGYLHNMLYAELVLPDPPAEPAPPDPFEALHIVKEFCRSVPLHTCANACPLYDWCEQLREGGDPTDWRIPEKEAGRA